MESVIHSAACRFDTVDIIENIDIIDCCGRPPRRRFWSAAASGIPRDAAFRHIRLPAKRCRASLATALQNAPVGSPRHGFTIIELLGVILTLATLFGLILPAVKLCTFNARKKQAAADATALSQAVVRYRQTYGFWPGADMAAGDPSEVRTLLALHSRPSWASDANIPFSTDFSPVALEFGAVIQALIPSEATAVEEGTNPRRIRFLDIPSSRIGADGLFRDPWGTPYVLVIHPPLEQTAEGAVPAAGDGPKIAGRAVGWSAVVAFSFGPPGRAVSAADNLIFSAGVPR